MPPPLNVDWPGIRAAAVALGNVSEAARRAASSLPPDEQERFREAVSKRASREGWIRPVQVVQQRPLPVLSGADTLAATIRDESQACRVHALRYGRKVLAFAEEIADASPGSALAAASDVKAAAQTAALAGGWAASGMPTVKVSLYGSPVVDIEAEVAGEPESDPQQ